MTAMIDAAVGDFAIGDLQAGTSVVSAPATTSISSPVVTVMLRKRRFPLISSLAFHASMQSPTRCDDGKRSRQHAAGRSARVVPDMHDVCLVVAGGRSPLLRAGRIAR
jgi:hypothetical protein